MSLVDQGEEEIEWSLFVFAMNLGGHDSAYHFKKVLPALEEGDKRAWAIIYRSLFDAYLDREEVFPELLEHLVRAFPDDERGQFLLRSIAFRPTGDRGMNTVRAHQLALP